MQSKSISIPIKVIWHHHCHGYDIHILKICYTRLTQTLRSLVFNVRSKIIVISFSLSTHER